jgi:hypothetical protein
MQIQLVAMLILTSSAQVRGDQRPIPEPPRAQHVTTIHLMTRGQSHELTLEMPALGRGNFDRWLFAREPSERARQEHLTDILDAKINIAATAHHLTDRERAKLRLAGRGDIKRFFDEVQKRRDDFEIERREFVTTHPRLEINMPRDSSEKRFRDAAQAEDGMPVSAGARIVHVRTAAEAGRVFYVDLSTLPEEDRPAVIAEIKAVVNRAVTRTPARKPKGQKKSSKA